MQCFEVNICASLQNKYTGSKNKDGCCGFSIEHHYKKTRGFFKYHCKVFFFFPFSTSKPLLGLPMTAKITRFFRNFGNAEIKTLQNVEKHIPHLQMTQIEENEQYADNLQNSCHFMVMSKLKMIPDYL